MKALDRNFIVGLYVFLMSNETSLLVFVKYPAPGKVKTRLGRQLGEDRSCRLYTVFVEWTLQRLARLRHMDCTIFFSPAEEADRFPAWLGGHYRYLAQPEGDLGARLRFGFETLLPTYSRVIAIGTDSPDLPLHYIEEADISLQNHPLCIGPSEDGGYYLIGMTQLYPPLFENIPWSTDSVFAETIHRARQENIPFKQLPSWYDIDTVEDIKKLISNTRNVEFLEYLRQNNCANLGSFNFKPGN